MHEPIPINGVPISVQPEVDEHLDKEIVEQLTPAALVLYPPVP